MLHIKSELFNYFNIRPNGIKKNGVTNRSPKFIFDLNDLLLHLYWQHVEERSESKIGRRINLIIKFIILFINFYF